MNINLPQELGWHSRGYLPHFDGGELAQFLTFRLHDALPGSVLLGWKEELKHEKPGEVEAIMRRRVEAYLDQGHGNCYLKDPSIATMVQNALLFHDRTKYRLAAWTVMPTTCIFCALLRLNTTLQRLCIHSSLTPQTRPTNYLAAKAGSGRKNISIVIFGMRGISPRSGRILKTIR
jgi:hypothetical protein